jgi:hypothetical protein
LLTNNWRGKCREKLNYRWHPINFRLHVFRYSHNKDEAKLKLRDRILLYGALPRANIRPTDLGPVILPEYEGFACREMRWG